jgi:hypothetical protein
VIKHQIDDYARDRNIEPKGKRPTRNPSVSDKVQPQGAIECDKYQRHYYDCQDGVRKENCEVNGPYNPLPEETRGAMVKVIGEVRSQENNGCKKRRELAISMGVDAPRFDETVTSDQEDRTRGIKNCIEMRKIGNETGHYAKAWARVRIKE